MTERRETFRHLRQQYPEFIYHGFSITKAEQGLTLTFDFEVPGLCRFTPQTVIPSRSFIRISPEREAFLENLVFHIGMIELVSYWKATCSPRIIIKPYLLDEAQLRWWKYLYYQGQGEFFYLNGLRPDPEDVVAFECSSSRRLPALTAVDGHGYLVPIGGGKDSVVTLELLRKHGHEVRPLIMNPRGATVNTAAVAGFTQDDCLILQRSIDPQLLRLNEQGFLNGHTPFSAMLAFYSLLAGELSGHSAIALSNEASANEATIPGTNINHQYSKSFEFETNFLEYVHNNISGDFQYFSFLRPLHEIQIARLFSRLPQYFPVFRSCNAGSKTDSWCGSCAKCLFAFIILSPWMEASVLQTVFGRDLLDDAAMQPYFDELCGYSENKPFECIGTVEEVRLALEMTVRRRTVLPLLLQHFLKHRDYRPTETGTADRLLHGMDPQHFLDTHLLDLLKSELS